VSHLGGLERAKRCFKKDQVPQRNHVIGAILMFYLAFVAAREQRLTHDQTHVTVAEIQTEFANVWEAWAWAMTQPRVVDLGGSITALNHKTLWRRSTG
jgi:hypothetical protein